MYCKKCGKELDDGKAFCPYCGQKQGEEIEESTPQKENHMSDKKIYAIGAVGAVVILAVIAIVKLVGRNNAAENSIVVNENATVEDIDGTKEVQKSTLDSTTVTEKESENTEKNSEDSNLGEAVNVQVASVKIGENEYWFDEDGDLIRAKDGNKEINISYLTDSGQNKVEYNPTMWGALLTTEYDGTPLGLLGISFFNANNHLCKRVEYKSENGELLQSSEFSYDDKNNLIKVNEMSTEYDWTSEILIDYENESNQIVFTDYYDDLSDSDHHISKYTYDFNNDDKLAKFTFDFSANAESGRTTEYTYDEKGNLICKKETTSIGVRTIDYNYDENRNVIIEEIHEDGTNDTNRTEYQYDEKGNLVRSEQISYLTYENGITELNADSSFYNKAVSANDHKQIYEYQYDDNGNMTSWYRGIESSNYDENGTLIQQSSSDWYQMREYNEDGKLTTYTWLASGTGSDVTDDTSEYLYDEQGRLIEITINGETAVTISYTDTGLLAGIDSVKETNTIDWDVIYNLLPETERDIMEVFGFLNYRNQDIIVEYR